MEPGQLIQLLINDRNYHINHLYETQNGFMYFVLACVVSIIGTLFLRHKDLGGIKKFFHSNKIAVLTLVFAMMLSLGIIIWGMAEHRTLHQAQRERLEKAINYVLVHSDTLDMNEFVTSFGSLRLPYKKNSLCPEPTMLFVAEPDTREMPQYHDMKLYIGLIIGFAGFAVFILFIILRKR